MSKEDRLAVVSQSEIAPGVSFGKAVSSLRRRHHASHIEARNVDTRERPALFGPDRSGQLSRCAGQRTEKNQDDEYEKPKLKIDCSAVIH